MSNKALRIVIKPDLDTNTQLEDDFSTEIFRRVCKACDTESPKFVLFRPQSREKEEFDSNIAPLLTKDHDDIILLTVFNNTGKSDSYLEEIIFTFKLHAMLVLSEGVLEIARNEDTFQQLSNILIDTYGFTRLEDGEKTLIHASLPVQPPVSVVKARAANSMATKRENETLYRWLIEREFTENSINKLIKEEFTNPGELAELNKSDIESLKLTLAQRKLLEKTVLTLQRPKSTPDQQREDKTLVTTRGLANNAESNTIPNATIYTTDILQTNTEDKDTGKQLRADEEAYTKRKQIKWSDDKRDEGCWQIIKLLEKYLPYLGFLPLLKNLHRAVDEDGTTDKATKETNLEDPMERTEKEMSKKIKWSDDKRDEGCWQIIKLLEKYLPYLGFLPLLKNLHRAVDEDGTTDKATKETNLEDPMERTEKEMSKKRLEDGKKTYEEAYTKSKQISEGTNETPNEELVTQKKQESDELRSLLNNDLPVKVTVMNDVDSKYTNSIVSALADTDDRYRHEGLQVLKISEGTNETPNEELVTQKKQESDELRSLLNNDPPVKVTVMNDVDSKYTNSIVSALADTDDRYRHEGLQVLKISEGTNETPNEELVTQKKQESDELRSLLNNDPPVKVTVMNDVDSKYMNSIVSALADTDDRYRHEGLQVLKISEGTNETPNEELVTQKKQESDELRSLLNNDPPVKVTVMNDVDSKYTNSIVSALADTDDRYRHEGLQVLKIFAFKWNKHIIEDHNALEELGWFRQHHRTHRRINVWVLQRDTILDAEKMKDNTHCHIVDWSEESQSRKDELQKKYFVPSSQIHFVNIVGNSQEDAKLSHLKVLKQIITSQSQ